MSGNYLVNLQPVTSNTMSHDIFQSVPQGGLGAQDAENSRIEAIVNELCRRCELYEAQCRDSQQDVSHLEMRLASSICSS